MPFIKYVGPDENAMVSRSQFAEAGFDHSTVSFREANDYTINLPADIAAWLAGEANFEALEVSRVGQPPEYELGYLENATGVKLALPTTWTGIIDLLTMDIEPTESIVWCEAEVNIDVTAVPALVGTVAAVQMIICTDVSSAANALASAVAYGAVQVETPASASGIGPLTLRAKGRIGPVAATKTLYVLVAKANVAGFSAEALNGNTAALWKSTLTAWTR